MADFCYDCTLEFLGGTEEEAIENDFAGIVRGDETHYCLCEGCGWITVDKDGRVLRRYPRRLQNKIELLGHYGSDELIACSAWTSTSRNLTEEKRNRVGKLINMLWSEGHETPFEKGVIHFLVDTDIASHIHLLKHRVSSLNAESARYKELKEDKYYIPQEWQKVQVSDKNIRVDANGPLNPNWATNLEKYTRLGNELYHACMKDLEPTLGRKRAKESARFFKTYNSQIQADIMFNMRSFANFIKLRNSEHAQAEIKEIAQEMWNLVENIKGQPFKHTLEAISVRIQSNS